MLQLRQCLFNIHTDDLYELFNMSDSTPVKAGEHTIGCLMYAGDILLLSESAAGLQKSLNELKQYCWKWKLPVNSTKTKTMVFSSSYCNSN